MIVVAIVALLASTIVPGFIRVRERSKIAHELMSIAGAIPNTFIFNNHLTEVSFNTPADVVEGVRHHATIENGVVKSVDGKPIFDRASHR